MAKSKKVTVKLKTVPAPAAPAMAPGAFVEKFTDHKKFFADVREGFGPLRQLQVDGFLNIFKAWDDAKLTDLRWLAYMFATAWHETAATMTPISEYGFGRGKKYGKPDKRTGLIYYGRGLVQLTWYDNYVLYGIEKTPEKANEPATAAHIMIDGMINGRFTGKKLSQYFSDKKNDPIGARRIINGTDKAKLIAGHYEKFRRALDQGVKVKSLT